MRLSRLRVWQAPLGYYRIKQGDNLTQEPESAPLIRLAFEEWEKGIYSYQSLAEFLEKKGLKTRHGKPPFTQLIEKILRNPIYCGIINVWGERYKGAFEPIISEGLFDRCQPEYKSQYRFVQRSAHNPEFPLRRMAVCGVCKTSLTGSFSTGRHGEKYAYYHHHKQTCPEARSLPKETFEQNFVEYLETITPDLKYEKLFTAIVVDIWKRNYKMIDEENAKIRKEVAKLEDERQKVFNLHRNGTYSNEEFTEQKAIVNQKITAKHTLIQEKREEEFSMEEALSYCFDFVRSTAATWLRLKEKYDIRLRFQKMIFEEYISFDGKKFGTADLACVYKLNQVYCGEESNLVAPGRIGLPFAP